MAPRSDRSRPRSASSTSGDFDYERNGAGYSARRRTDPRIAAHVWAALGDARTVLNVGAGAGSYEPEDRYVVAVEPSAAMRAQRRSDRPAVDAVAEALPFDTRSFDATMAMITVHQWPDLERGLGELRRVARGPGVAPPSPRDCVDGFIEAYYARPHAFLDPAVRAAQSAWSHTGVDVTPGLAKLREDLDSGAWEERYGDLRERPEYVGSLRMITSS